MGVQFFSWVTRYIQSIEQNPSCGVALTPLPGRNARCVKTGPSTTWLRRAERLIGLFRVTCLLPSLTWLPFWWRSWWRRRWRPFRSAAAWTSPSCGGTRDDDHKHKNTKKTAAQSVGHRYIRVGSLPAARLESQHVRDVNIIPVTESQQQELSFLLVLVSNWTFIPEKLGQTQNKRNVSAIKGNLTKPRAHKSH